MLQIEGNTIIQQIGSYQKVWPVSELLEAHNPFPEAPLAMRTAALQHAIDIASKSPLDYSTNIRILLNFWKHFNPENIREQDLDYTSSAGTAGRWKLTINQLGLLYTDVSGQFSSNPGVVTEQLFHDFWFFGPLRPMPELSVRQTVLKVLKKALDDPECPAAWAHFELFEYPDKPNPRLRWTAGDHYRTDEVWVGRDGIELSSSNWRDPIPQQGFLSFENLLNAPLNSHALISPEIRAGVEAYLGRVSKHNPVQTIEAAQPSPRDKMEKAERLLQDPDSVEGAEILISLLEYEAEESYWRNYVFNRFFKLRSNRVVQNFVVQCLQGDNETHFKKSVDVLTMWGIYGDKALMDRALLLSLNWEDACANDPDFRQAFEKALPIIQQKNN